MGARRAREGASGARLSLVGTPIGNLGDITLRALETLRAADLILAEDTRRTRALLAHYGVGAPLESYHANSPPARAARILAALAEGRRVALVSDAGMPGISDPGGELAARAAAAGVPVEAVPGPSAVVTAVALAGLPGSRFAFEGFLPSRPAARRRALADAARLPHLLVFYEAPHRLAASLGDMRDVLGGDRRAVVARELTKLHEETRRGTLAELAGWARETTPRGEITVVVEGAGGGTPAAPRDPAADEAFRAELVREYAELLAGGTLSRRDAVRALAERHGLERQALYRLLTT